MAERVSPNDLLDLAVGTGTVPSRIAAILWTRPAKPLRSAGRAVVGERLLGVPRLRQQLRSPPFWCSRPFLGDVPRFDLAAHITQRRCPPPGEDHPA